MAGVIPSEPQRLLIIGAANAEIAKLIRAVNRVSRRYEPLGYLDDDHTRWGETFMGLEVVGPVIQLLTPNHADNVAVVSIGFAGCAPRGGRTLGVCSLASDLACPSPTSICGK